MVWQCAVWCTNCPAVWEPLENSKSQKCDMQQVCAIVQTLVTMQ